MSNIAFNSPNLEATQSPTKGRVERLRHAQSGKLPSTAQREQGQAITTYTRVNPFTEKSKTRTLTYSDGKVSDSRQEKQEGRGDSGVADAFVTVLITVTILRVCLDVKTDQGVHLTCVHFMSNTAQKAEK